MILKKSNHTFFRANYYLLLVAAFLIVISFIIEKYWSSTSTDEGVTKLLQKNIQSKQKDFAAFCKDTNLIRKLATKKYNEETLHEIEKKDYFLFIIKNDTAQVAPVFWSTQVVWPDESIITGKDTSYLTLLTNGWYIFNNKTILQGDSIAYDIIALIPVKWDYYVQNKYLQNTFVGVEGLEKQYDISHQEEKIAIKVALKNNKAICKDFVMYIKKKEDNERLKTTEEILQEMRNDARKKKNNILL